VGSSAADSPSNGPLMVQSTRASR